MQILRIVAREFCVSCDQRTREYEKNSELLISIKIHKAPLLLILLLTVDVKKYSFYAKKKRLKITFVDKQQSKAPGLNIITEEMKLASLTLKLLLLSHL
jgi:hypothetical protein